MRILQKPHARKGKSLNRAWTSWTTTGPTTHLTTLQGSGPQTMMGQWLVTPHLDQDCCCTYFLFSNLVFTLLLCGCVKHQVWRPEKASWSGVSVCTFMWVPGVRLSPPGLQITHFYLNHLLRLEPSPTTNWKTTSLYLPWQQTQTSPTYMAW